MLHQTAGFALGRQAAQASAAASYVRGRVTSSGINPRYDRSDNTGEHVGLHERPTTRQSTAIRSGYLEDVAFASRLYPLMVGHALIGAGFTVSSAVASGAAYNHTFTLAAAASQNYITALHLLGEGGARFGRVAKDVKLSQLQFTANKQGAAYTAQGLGIGQANDTGSETFTTELDYVLSPYNGSFTVTSSDITANTLGTPRGMQITIANPLGEEEQALATMSRASLTSQGLDITGTASGLIFSEEILREWNYGASGSAALDQVIPVSQLSWVWASPVEILTAHYYQMTWTIPITQGFMQPVDITGGGQIVYDLNWEMTDAIATAPITIVLKNNKTNYTAD